VSLFDQRLRVTSRTSGSIRIRAHAKLNLTLRVLGTRPDGYHQLRTVFQSLALHDTLIVRAAPGPFAIECDDPACPIDRRNLVWKAADRLWRRLGNRGAIAGVRIRITKRIPMQAGLGGGSSDAAVTLAALAAWWRAGLTGAELGAIAGELGADVPFFLEGGTALGLERGDLIFPMPDCQPSWIVLVLPAFGVSTGDAFTWWDERVIANPRQIGRSRPDPQIAGLQLPAGEWVNDLEAPVAARHPVIRRLTGRLSRAGAAYTAMSGSGSAVFGLFETEPQAVAAANALAAPGWQVQVTGTLNRRRYRQLSTPRAF
jgi:4-diphosphocytidyl-2-C-methyl-D-erythritol kinase